MPTYNRAWSLPQVLVAIEGFDYTKERIRLVFVDNNSTDGTQEILRCFQKKHLNEYESIRVLIEETNIAQARTICVQEAEGSDYVLFVDSDIVSPPNTVKHLLEIFAENPNAGFAGFPPQRLPTPIGERAWFSKMPNKPHMAETIGHDCTMVKMKVFEKVGFYNPAFGADEDTELILRAKKVGYVVVLNPSVKVLHLIRQRNSTFFTPVVDYARFAFSKMAYYRFRLLLDSRHSKTLLRWGFYTLLMVCILLLPATIVLEQIILSILCLIPFMVLLVFHAVRSSGIMRVVNPFFYAFIGMMWAAGMWNQLIKHLVRKLRRKISQA